MTAFYSSDIFLVMWVGYLFIMICGIGAALVWGVRNGQFGNQERARYLPLDAEIPRREGDTM